jgi:polar amino acid transport system permease protein
MMGSLKRIRPSNLIILAAMPFILYVFFTSGDYRQSLRAIIGIEDGALLLLRDFLLLVLLLLSGILRPALLLRDRWRANATSGHLFRAPINEARQHLWRNLAILAAWLNLILAPVLAWLLWRDCKLG